MYKQDVAVLLDPMQERGCLTIKECRNLLQIATRETINSYLKELGLFGRKFLDWSEIKKLVEIQVFLGLRPGCNSLLDYSKHSPEELVELFEKSGVNIEERFRQIQGQHFKGFFDTSVD